ncbi:FAD-binding protein [Treponema denticola]|uniref:FAD-binding protein n=1 Tax=Treponema denticola TaxID=158 RepID=UPI002106B257|nr:FAD-binding protein [Treponema denticola]
MYGGGSSVTRGVEAGRGGISLDMRKNFNKVLAFNETDQTITVRRNVGAPTGSSLKQCSKRFNAKMAYTCGHFPQSFEYLRGRLGSYQRSRPNSHTTET